METFLALIIEFQDVPECGSEEWHVLGLCIKMQRIYEIRTLKESIWKVRKGEPGKMTMDLEWRFDDGTHLWIISPIQ